MDRDSISSAISREVEYGPALFDIFLRCQAIRGNRNGTPLAWIDWCTEIFFLLSHTDCTTKNKGDKWEALHFISRTSSFSQRRTGGFGYGSRAFPREVTPEYPRASMKYPPHSTAFSTSTTPSRVASVRRWSLEMNDLSGWWRDHPPQGAEQAVAGFRRGAEPPLARAALDRHGRVRHRHYPFAPLPSPTDRYRGPQHHRPLHRAGRRLVSIAGIRDESDDLGPCFSMITTTMKGRQGVRARTVPR